MITDTFIQKLQDNWKEAMPIVKEEVLKILQTDSLEIDFTGKYIDKIPNDFGVYLFQIYPTNQFDFIDFRNNWKSIQMPIHSPSISISRIQFDKCNKWYPLYIGKAEKLSNRINEHCFQDFNKTTYGLKLKHRKSLLENSKIRFSYYRITDKKLFDKNAIQFVMTNLEREIRNDIKPWIGKQ